MSRHTIWKGSVVDQILEARKHMILRGRTQLRVEIGYETWGQLRRDAEVDMPDMPGEIFGMPIRPRVDIEGVIVVDREHVA